MTVPFKSPLVVGYKGEVGSFLLNGLLRIMPKALNIWCFDINETKKECEARIKLADFIFLCVPIQDTIPWLLENKYLLKDKFIIEQTSIKAPLYGFEGFKDLQLIPMHLLFRPSATPDSADRRCALIDWFIKVNSHVRTLDFIKAIKEMTGCSEMIFYESIEAHDKDMALQQALVHRVLLVLGELLKGRSNTYVSRKVFELSERIKAGDRHLYSVIQNNKDLPKILEKFKDQLNYFKIKEFLIDLEG